MLAGSLLVGCMHSTNHYPPAADGAADNQQPVRVIVFFSRPPVADSLQVMTAISEACRCFPVFIRPYADNALIYEIVLPQGQSFAAFEGAVLVNGISLGVQAVEQDVQMRHQ